MESCFFLQWSKAKGLLEKELWRTLFFSKRPLYSTPLLLLLYYYYNINEPGCSNNCHRVTTSHMQVSMPALAPLPLHTFTQVKKYLWKNFFVLLKRKFSSPPPTKIANTLRPAGTDPAMALPMMTGDAQMSWGKKKKLYSTTIAANEGFCN